MVMMPPAVWYFDFISPYSYIGMHRLRDLPPGLVLEYRPVLFAGLLSRFGQKGPAEIESKRRYTYRWCHWWAKSLGIRFRFPAAHPFNPLHHLRLAIACGSTPQAVECIFEAIWTTGADASDATAFNQLALSLGVDAARLGSADVKDVLRRNTEEAAARGIFGVPTLELNGEFFWGADAIDFARAFLADPAVLRNAEIRRLDSLPVGAARRT